MAGGQHHHRTNLDKYHPGYFGKVGMRYFHKLQNQFWKPVINLDKVSRSNHQQCDQRTVKSNVPVGSAQKSTEKKARNLGNGTSFTMLTLAFLLQLWSLVPQDKRDEYLADKKGDTAPVLDLLPLGYSKVLGKGRIPEIPMVVRARFFSREAERKIKEAGGVVELVA